MLNEIKNFQILSDSISSAGQPLEDQLKFVKEAGFEVVINLGLLNNPEYSLRDEAGSIRALGMEYIHIPVIFEQPTIQNLEDFFMDIVKESNHER